MSFYFTNVIFIAVIFEANYTNLYPGPHAKNHELPDTLIDHKSLIDSSCNLLKIIIIFEILPSPKFKITCLTKSGVKVLIPKV